MRIARRNLAAAGTVTASSTAAGYSPDYLVDGDTTRPWIAAEGASAAALRVDLDAFGGAGGFEDWADGVPVNAAGDEFGEDRSTGTGSTTEAAGPVYAGSSALKFTCTTGERRRVFRVSEVSGRAARPGEAWTAVVGIHGDGVGFGKVGVYDPITGKWWDPAANAGAGGWTAAETYLGSWQAISYLIVSDVVTLEGWDAHQCAEVDLEIHLVLATTGQECYFDALAAWPHWDEVIVHGHNVPPAQTVTVYALSSPSWGSGTLIATLSTPRRPACYALLGALRTERYCEVIIPGTHPTQLYVGELVVGQSEEPVEYPLLAQPVEWESLQSRVRSGRRQHVTVYTTDPARAVSFTFEFTSLDDLDLFRGLWEGLHFGADLVAVVPSTDEPVVYLGRFAAVWAPRRVGPDVYQLELSLAEDGFPTVGL